MRNVHAEPMIARTSDGRLISRPLSPHIQIYRWPVSMVLSILHRVSGCVLGIGTLLLTSWILSVATSPNAFAAVQWFMGSVPGLILLFGWTVALAFHFFSGIRHLAWDAGFGFSASEYRTTAWSILIATGAFTALLWFIGLTLW